MLTRQARIRVTRRWLLAALVVYVVVGFLPVAGAAYDHVLWILAFILGEVALGAAHSWLPRKFDEEARASEDGIWIGGRQIASRTSIQSAHVRTWRGSTWLRLQRRFGPIDIGLDSPEDEAAWLSALRLDAAGVVARYLVHADRRSSRAARTRWYFATVAPLVALVVMFVVASLLVAGRGTGLFVAVPAIGAGALAVQFAALARILERVAIGADGLRLRRILGRSRFIPFASIASVAVEPYDVVVQLHDGKTIAWHRQWGTLKSLQDHFHGFAARIERGLPAHRALVAGEGVVQLARGARSVDAWVHDLRVASDPERTTYRVAALPPDELWKTVVSATAAPTARAGAAIALQRVLDEPARKRLRDVAATCASDELRSALEAAATDDPELERRLESLHDGAS